MISVVRAYPQPLISGIKFPETVKSACNPGLAATATFLISLLVIILSPAPRVATASPVSPFPGTYSDRDYALNPPEKSVPLTTPSPTGNGQQQPLRSLQDDFAVSISIYRDHHAGCGYFELSIAAKSNVDLLAPHSQDWLFLIDASSSISYHQYVEFCKGIKVAMNILTPADRFNIITFRVHHEDAFPHLVAPTTANILAAENFLHSHRPLGKTAIDAALLTSLIGAENEHQQRSCHLFFFSDGHATSGSALEDNVLIRQITRENSARVSISTFSCSADTNLYFMDFLAYLNRGVSIHQKAVERSYISIASYFQSLRELVLADPICIIAGASVDEVFPKRLPHLYHGRPVYLTGRYPTATRTLSIRLQGRDKNGRQQQWGTILHLNSIAESTPSVATRWAAQNICTLLSARDPQNSAMIERDIAALARKYQVIIPYE